MSSLVMFSIQDEIDYSNEVKLSELLVNYCLLNNKGVIFNFLGYSEDFIRELHPNFYFFTELPKKTPRLTGIFRQLAGDC